MGSPGGRAATRGGQAAIVGGRAAIGDGRPAILLSPIALPCLLSTFCIFFHEFGRDMLLHPTFVHNSWNRLVIHETLINYASNMKYWWSKMDFIDCQHPAVSSVLESSSVETSLRVLVRCSRRSHSRCSSIETSLRVLARCLWRSRSRCLSTLRRCRAWAAA